MLAGSAANSVAPVVWSRSSVHSQTEGTSPDGERCSHSLELGRETWYKWEHLKFAGHRLDLNCLIEIKGNCFEIVEIKKLGRLTGAKVRLAARS